MRPPDERPERITEALAALRAGEPSELDRILPAVYHELHAIAARQMSGERVGHTLQPTALLNEAWIRLSSGDESGWEDRSHFFAVAARAMRQVLVDHARRRAAHKRGGDLQRVTLHDEIATDGSASEFDLLDLHEAIDKLTALDPRLGQLIDLRFFGGLTLDETAAVMQVSRRKVAMDWSFARVWLARELSGDD